MKKKFKNIFAGLGIGFIAVPTIFGGTTFVNAQPQETYYLEGELKDKGQTPEALLESVTDTGTLKSENWEFEAETEGIAVKATAPKEVFEPDTVMVVRRLNGEETVDFIDKINEQTKGDYTTAIAADVSFRDADGNEIEPTSDVDISFTFEDQLTEVVSPEIAHIKDDGDVEIVDAYMSEDYTQADFSLDSFSPVGYVDNPGNKDTLTMRNSEMVINMKLNVIDYGAQTNVPLYTYHESMTEGQIHSTRDGDKLYCGNSFNDFYTGTFTAHNASEYFDDYRIQQMAYAQFVCDHTPEYAALSENEKYFITQAFVWAFTAESYFPEDVGNNRTMFVTFPNNSKIQSVYDKCFRNVLYPAPDRTLIGRQDSSGTWCGDVAFDADGRTFDALTDSGIIIEMYGKKYVWNKGKVTAYVNEAYGFNKTKNHNGTCQSALQIQYDIDEVTFGKIDLIKASGDSSLTNGNECYALAGAEFTLTNTSNPSIKYVITTDSSGRGHLDNVEAGTYKVEETKAPKGYKKANIGNVTVESGKTATINVSDPVKLDPIPLKLTKIDADGNTIAQGDGTFAGAEFTVEFWAKHFDGEPTGTPTKKWTFVTNANGEISTNNAFLKAGSDSLYPNGVIPIGTVRIRETKAPVGYLISDEAANGYVLKINEATDNALMSLTGKNGIAKLIIKNEANQEYSLLENPQKGMGGVKKVDADTKRSEPQGDATLENITFDLYNRSANSVMYKGKEYAKDAKMDTLTTKKTDDGYTVLTDKLAYGTYEVIETKAGSNKSYVITEQSQKFEIRKDGEIKKLSFKNPVVKGKIKAVKVDAETGKSETQGDGSFAGIQFAVFNESKNSIVYEGKEYKPNANEAFTTITLEKDNNGEWSATTGDLPYGTYSIQEIKTTDSYRLTDGKKHKVQVRENEKVYTETFSNEVIRGEIDMTKFDLELNKSEALGSATLEDIHFNVTNRSNSYVLYNPVNKEELAKVNTKFASKKADKNGLYRFEVGEVVDVLVTKWDAKANKYHKVSAELPYGTYALVETKTNKTYNLTPETIENVRIRKDGEVVERIKHDQVKRTDFDFVKIADSSSKRMSVPFKVSLFRTKEDRDAGKNAMETHVIVTDENGMYNSAIYAHSDNTNANDALLTKKNIKASDYNTEAGTWFSMGEFGDAAVVNDSLGALPYGYYTIEEMECENNKGYDMQKFDFAVLADKAVIPSIHLGTVTDDKLVPRIGTKASGLGGTQLVSAVGQSATIVDTIGYENLLPNTEYVFKTWVVRKENHEVVSEKVTTKYKTGADKIGEAQAEITFNTAKCKGEDVVVYEEVYDKTGKTLIAEHKDIDDEGQTIHIPNIGTQAQGEDGLKTLKFFNKTVVVDKVSYTNMEPNTEYTLKTWIVNKEDGKRITSVATTKYKTGDERDGVADAYIIVDTTTIQGKDIVVYEEWYTGDGSTLIGEHKDIDDEGQTLYVPGIGTTATGTDESKLLVVTDKVDIVDVVKYTNLEPKTTYTLKTWAVRKSDGEKISEDVTTVFETGLDRDGTAKATVTINSTELKGEDVVIFEEVYDESGKTLISEHKDITDDGQTVHIPDMKTKATGFNGGKIIVVNDKSEFTDTITYTNMEPETEYTIKTWAVRKSDGEKVSEETVTKYTTGKERDGEATAKITVDATKLTGEGIVVFEEWYNEDGTLIVDHKDTDDEDQTVIVPKMGTTATGLNGSKTVAVTDKAEIIDKIAYENMEPNTEYTLNTWAVKKSDETVCSNIVTTKYTTGDDRNGVAEVLLAVDTKNLKGEDIVVYEEWKDADGKTTIVEHKDKDDEGQTVRVPDMSTTATDVNGNKEVQAGVVDIIDTIKYKGMDSEHKYFVKTWVVRKSDSQVVSQVVETPVTISENDGEIKVTIPKVDVTALANGDEIVVFEEWYAEDKTTLIVEHKDINDKDQTVKVVKETKTTTNNVKSPNTGDASNVGLYIGLACAAATAGAVSGGIIYKKRKNAKETV